MTAYTVAPGQVGGGLVVHAADTLTVSSGGIASAKARRLRLAYHRYGMCNGCEYLMITISRAEVVGSWRTLFGGAVSVR